LGSAGLLLATARFKPFRNRSFCWLSSAAIKTPLGLIFASLIFAAACSELARAAECPSPSSEIATDRPDVTNSSLVVPEGSFQSENGINVSHRDGASIFDGTNSRVRLGVAPCLEILVDVPNYFATFGHWAGSGYISIRPAPRSILIDPRVYFETRRGGTDFGFTDVIPAMKWQISPEPGKLDLSVTAGVGLPSGVKRIAGPGFQPYIQFPWSRELEDGWGLSGMITEFFHPSDSPSTFISEVTFVIEKKLTEKISVFVEYVGDYPDQSSPSPLLNFGIVYHLTRTQQLDMHLAFGLNHNAPDYIAGIGYSFRLDGLF
jgi:Putative MetA-pathway of phenol degradation